MGVFNWIFRRYTTVPSAEIREWLLQKNKEKKEFFSEQIREKERIMENLLLEINEEIKALQVKELQNQNIPVRHKHFMWGNRNEFIKQTQKGIQEKRFDVLSIEKPAAVLNEFFGKETKQIIVKMGEYEKIRNELSQIQQPTEYEILMQKIEEYEQKQQEAIKAKRTIDAFKEETDELRQSIARKKMLSEKMLNSEGYIACCEKAKKLAGASKKMSNEIAQHFAPLQDAIQKYAHTAFHHKQLVQAYIENPAIALSTDVELQITEVLFNTKEMIGTEIQLKDEERKQKALEAIELLSREYLNELLREYALIHKQAREAEQEKNNHENIKKTEALNQEIQSISRTIEEKEKEIKKQQKIIFDTPKYPDELLEKMRIKLI